MTVITKYVEVEVEVDLKDLAKDLSDDQREELVNALRGTIGVPQGLGDGDLARVNNIIERAYNAARKLPSVPREIADLFWHIHGRALA